MDRYALFFRGVNIGARQVRMTELAECLRKLGGTQVKTILQSGSAVFVHPATSPDELRAIVSEAFKVSFGFNSVVHVRTAEEWAGVIAKNPFPQFAHDRPNHLLVYVGSSEFREDEVIAFQKQVTGPEELVALGRELFVTYPEGIGPSTLPKVKGYEKLVGDATSRNWNTVLKIREALFELA